jgi:bla regulator protein BlaR1
MLIWMVYVIAVSLLLGIAALAAERSARLRRATTRGYWLIAILASLLVPTVIASVSIQMPDVLGAAAAEKIVVLRNSTSIPLSPQAWLGANDAKAAEWRSLDPLVTNAWLTVSALMLLVLVVNGVQLLRRRRVWQHRNMHGTDVLVAPDVGPAVVGFLQPRIVVPAWLTQAPQREQAAVMAHEQSHLKAGDPQLFTVALCLLVFMPWNLPLWWQLRRLRNAIEVDCDARVLDSGHDAIAYGETLISVGERQSAYIGAVAAMSESPAFLEERISIMTSKPMRLWQLPAAALLALSITLVAVAAQVSPPNAQTAAGATQEITVDSAILERYVGTYKLSDAAVMKITRAGTQLSTQLTGQQTVPIFASSQTRFFPKVVKAEIEFIAEGTAPASALVLYQNGQTMRMPRIDASTAQQIESNLTARIQNNVPSPGTEAALRQLLARREAGQPPAYETMSPQLAEAVRTQLPQSTELFARLGKMQSMQFQGVGAQGYDAYLVKYENGSLVYRIALDPNGIIVGLLLQPL